MYSKKLAGDIFVFIALVITFGYCNLVMDWIFTSKVEKINNFKFSLGPDEDKLICHTRMYKEWFLLSVSHGKKFYSQNFQLRVPQGNGLGPTLFNIITCDTRLPVHRG